MAGQQTRGRRSDFADTDGKPTKSDEVARRRERRGRDAPLEAAYQAGYRGDDPAEHQVSDEVYGYYEDGAAARKAEDRVERRGEIPSRITSSAPARKAGSLAADGAGFLLGLFAYALLSAYLGGGTKGVRAWLAAKFLNRTSADAAKAKAPATPAKPSGAGA